MMKKLALLLLPLAVLSSCVNPFFEKLLKEEDSEKVELEIEASLSWRNDWIAEGQGLARDTDNEFASDPGNPLKAVPTEFFQDSFEAGAHTSATAVYPAQKWESEAGGTSAAFVIYYRIPGVDVYGDPSAGNLYLRRIWDGDTEWGDWIWVDPSEEGGSLFKIEGGDLFFKTAYYFANVDAAGTWTKRGNSLTVEVALFESPEVTPTGQNRADILSVRKRLKQRVFTVDLSGVTFNPGNGYTPTP
jgi:hypothetical protein